MSCCRAPWHFSTRRDHEESAPVWHHPHCTLCLAVRSRQKGAVTAVLHMEVGATLPVMAVLILVGKAARIAVKLTSTAEQRISTEPTSSHGHGQIQMVIVVVRDHHRINRRQGSQRGRRRIPVLRPGPCTGDERVLQCGSIRTRVPSISSSADECPNQVHAALTQVVPYRRWPRYGRQVLAYEASQCQTRQGCGAALQRPVRSRQGQHRVS